MDSFTSLGGKIVRHIYPSLDLFYFNFNWDYPDVIKGAFEKFDTSKQIFVVKNAKQQLKISSSAQYGTVVLSFDEILAIVKSEMATDRPKLNQLISHLNDVIMEASKQNRG